LALGLGASLATAVALAQAPKAKQAASSAPDEKTPIFSRDIAPVLVGNCVGCHSPSGKAAKKFDMSTFKKLRAGGVSGQTITPGKPEESELVLRIKGESEGPKMPPGNDKDIAARRSPRSRSGSRPVPSSTPARATPRMRRWTAYAATPESLRRDELAKMTPEQQEERLAAVALERWKKASATTTPEKTSSPHFLLFGQLPKERAEAILKQLEGQYLALRGLLGQPGAMALNGPEKLSLYVFNDRTQYVEFVRGLENRDIEMGIEAHANFGVESPYIAAADPLGGARRPVAGPEALDQVVPEEAGRGVRGARTLPGRPAGRADGHRGAEPGGQAPALAEPGLRGLPRLAAGAPQPLLPPPPQRHLRPGGRRVDDQVRRGPRRRHRGGEGPCHRLQHDRMARLGLPAPVPRLHPRDARGPEKLDDQLGKVFNASRQEFLGVWGNWIATHYRRTR
jgi:mono/diheme cytochrome c family protein